MYFVFFFFLNDLKSSSNLKLDDEYYSLEIQVNINNFFSNKIREIENFNKSENDVRNKKK